MRTQKKPFEPREKDEEARERKELREELERGNRDGLVFLEDGTPISRREKPPIVETKIPAGDKRHTSDRGGDTPSARFSKNIVVRVYSDVWDTIVRETKEFNRLGRETGFALLGKKSGEKGRRVFDVVAVIDAGPKSKHNSAELEFDREYQQKVLDEYNRLYPSIGFIGTIHNHPSPGMNRPSGMEYSPDDNIPKHTDYYNALKSLRGEDSVTEFVEGILTFPESPFCDGIPKARYYYISREYPRYYPIGYEVLEQNSPYPQDIFAVERLPWFLCPLRVEKPRLGVELDLIRAEGFEPKIGVIGKGIFSFLVFYLDYRRKHYIFLLPPDYPIRPPSIISISENKNLKCYDIGDLSYRWTKNSYLINLLRPLGNRHKLLEKLRTSLKKILSATRNIAESFVRLSLTSIVGREK